MKDLKKLYSNLIKTHSEAPFHFEKRDDAENVIRAYNPVCGDRFDLFLDVKEKIIHDLYFNGFGCAISKASTSILMKSLEGKTVDEGLKICDVFLDFIDKKVDNTEVPDEFKAFSGVHDFPERYDCAALSWKEMKRFLEGRVAGGGATT